MSQSPDALAGVVAQLERAIVGKPSSGMALVPVECVTALLAALAEARKRVDELTGPEMARKIRTAVLTLPTIYDRADGPFVSRTDAICAVLDVTHPISRTPQPETPE